MEKITEIKNDLVTAKINLSRGANLISFVDWRYDASVLREPDYDNLDNPYLYGMPVLFPVNRISKGKFEFQGRTYSFPVNEPGTGCHLHGILHDKEFTVKEQKEDYLKCEYMIEATDGFPHKVNVTAEYSLTDGIIEQKLTFDNLSQYDMPCFLGFHTTFNVPFVKGSDADDILIRCGVSYVIERGNDYLPTGRISNNDTVTKALRSGTFKSLSNPISRHYKANNQGEIVLYDTKKNLSLIYETDKKFTFRLIYNGDGSEFICLEPQNCMVDAINSNFGDNISKIDVIASKSKKEYISKLYITKGNECI